MTTTRTQAPPQPPVLHARHAHRPHRAVACSFSTSSSTSISTASSAASSPSRSPSPRTTSVPFSWEDHPGIPKSCCLRSGADPKKACSPPPMPLPLPLPPPLRAPPSRRRANRRPPPASGPAADPFAAALAECTREHATTGGGVIDIDMDAVFPPTPAESAATAGRPGRSRRWSVATGGVVWFLDLYGCKSAMAVAEGAFVVRRPVNCAGPGRADQGQGQGRTGRAGRR